MMWARFAYVFSALVLVSLASRDGINDQEEDEKGTKDLHFQHAVHHHEGMTEHGAHQRKGKRVNGTSVISVESAGHMVTRPQARARMTVEELVAQKDANEADFTGYESFEHKVLAKQQLASKAMADMVDVLTHVLDDHVVNVVEHHRVHNSEVPEEFHQTLSEVREDIQQERAINWGTDKPTKAFPDALAVIKKESLMMAEYKEHSSISWGDFKKVLWKFYSAVATILKAARDILLSVAMSLLNSAIGVGGEGEALFTCVGTVFRINWNIVNALAWLAESNIGLLHGVGHAVEHCEHDKKAPMEIEIGFDFAFHVCALPMPHGKPVFELILGLNPIGLLACPVDNWKDPTDISQIPASFGYRLGQELTQKLEQIGKGDMTNCLKAFGAGIDVFPHFATAFGIDISLKHCGGAIVEILKAFAQVTWMTLKAAWNVLVSALGHIFRAAVNLIQKKLGSNEEAPDPTDDLTKPEGESASAEPTAAKKIEEEAREGAEKEEGDESPCHEVDMKLVLDWKIFKVGAKTLITLGPMLNAAVCAVHLLTNFKSAKSTVQNLLPSLGLKATAPDLGSALSALCCATRVSEMTQITSETFANLQVSKAGFGAPTGSCTKFNEKSTKAVLEASIIPRKRSQSSLNDADEAHLDEALRTVLPQYSSKWLHEDECNLELPQWALADIQLTKVNAYGGRGFSYTMAVDAHDSAAMALWKNSMVGQITKGGLSFQGLLYIKYAPRHPEDRTLPYPGKYCCCTVSTRGVSQCGMHDTMVVEAKKGSCGAWKTNCGGSGEPAPMMYYDPKDPETFKFVPEDRCMAEDMFLEDAWQIPLYTGAVPVIPRVCTTTGYTVRLLTPPAVTEPTGEPTGDGEGEAALEDAAAKQALGPEALQNLVSTA